MSGVCAVVARGQAVVDPGVLDGMVAAAPHRSGGGTARHVEQAAGLAQLARWAEPRVQPDRISAAEPATVVVADARIDNTVELCAALGPDAPSDRDDVAALIGATYRRWGAAGTARMIGDFAFVLWDRAHRRLVLARDPMAMRALYYRVEPERVLVATEVAQLLAVEGVPHDPDERMVAAYLAGCFGSLEWTWYGGINQVAPGHIVVVQDGTVRTWRYWDVDPELEIIHDTQTEYAEHLRTLYLDAVRARMRGARPVGVLLSGGIDSGAAASAAGWLREREQVAAPVHSYSFDYGSLTQCDERHVSCHIVERYGLRSADVFAEDAGPLAGYPAHAPDLDDPFHGHFQTLLDRTFAQARRDGVGRLFTGMRGDLAIGPIDENYATLLRTRRWGALAEELRRHAAMGSEGVHVTARRHLGPIVVRAARRRTSLEWMRRIVRRTGGGSAEQHEAAPPWIPADLARRVDLTAILTSYSDAVAPTLHGALRRRRYQWLFMPMHLRWAASHERRVARFGMEAVDAWSDRRVAEFSLAVPQQALDDPTSADKRLARAAMHGVMPEDFRRQAGKTVPTPLYEQTLRTTAVPTVRGMLSDSRADAAGWLDAGCLLDHYDRFVAGGPAPAALWWALTVEWWMRVRETGGVTLAP